MNFLAHIYLSGDNRDIQVGNFIGDFVKGSAYNGYPNKVKQGILLHRAIDDFTDKHPEVIEAIAWLKPQFGRYSGIFIDMFYDYFLASEWQNFSPIPLRRFARGFYWSMICHYSILPKQVRGFLPHLIVSNRLCLYATTEGLQRSLEIMERVTSLPKQSEEAIRFLTTNHSLLRENFYNFFPTLQQFVAEKIAEN